MSIVSKKGDNDHIKSKMIADFYEVERAVGAAVWVRGKIALGCWVSYPAPAVKDWKYLLFYEQWVKW